MNKKIITVIVLFITVAICGCINSPIDDVNLLMPKISQNIEEGNNNYNDAVNFVNSRNYNAADEKAKKSTASFNEGLNKLISLKNNDLNDTLYIQYIDLLKEELTLKQDATMSLQLAIQYFKSGNNGTANQYVKQANSLMIQGVSIQTERQNLVANNPERFQ